ncbi:hypothetical protein ACH4FE_10105 [Streptomyces celluloflavus]|uniref:hypothetical protein n=1 Tax=Streptomyces celluloflavus TaxID=58344 RepID=UPI00378AFD84
MPEQIWHPISKLEFFVDYTRRWAIDVRERLETLEEARTKPHVLAGSEVARIKRVYVERADGLALSEGQRSSGVRSRTSARRGG